MNSSVLLIDTSSRHLIFARLDREGKGKVIHQLSEGRSEDLIDNAVGSLFPRVEDIGEIWLGDGPGSFVGLRSSFAYVRMLAMLAGTPCRTFFSSRLWRVFFAVAPEAWLLTRTNARLYYADRFTTARETLVVDIAAEGEKPQGEVYCFSDTWISAAPNNIGGHSTDQGWKHLTIGDAQIAADALTPENLALTQPKSPADLNPIYGHELNFTLAKGNNG